MNATERTAFEVPGLPIGPIPEGTSILLTGEESAAIESVFYRLVAASEDERSLILATETNGRTVSRELDRVAYGTSNRSTVLTCQGVGDADNVSTVDDIGDLTGVGIQFSALVTESGAMAAAQRAGILLCSSICREVDDIGSVFRFLNANFLTHLRREEIMGVCAVDTSASLGGATEGLVESMAAAFGAHIDIETTDTDSEAAVLGVTGLDSDADRLRVDLST